MAAGCIQESCIYERCLTPEDSAAAIGNSIPLRSTPFPIAEPYSKFSVFFDYTFLDNSKKPYNITVNNMKKVIKMVKQICKRKVDGL